MPKFDDVNVGDELPTLTKSPDRAQLVLYCAGSGDCPACPGNGTTNTSTNDNDQRVSA